LYVKQGTCANLLLVAEAVIIGATAPSQTGSVSAWVDTVGTQAQPLDPQMDSVSSSASGSSSGPPTPTAAQPDNDPPPATRRWADYDDDEDLDPLDGPMAGAVYVNATTVEAYEDFEKMTVEDAGDFVSAPIPENNDWELDSWAGDGGIGEDGWKNENPRFGTAVSVSDNRDVQFTQGGGGGKNAADAKGVQKTKKDFEKEITCDVHGIICKKKLCLEHSEQVRKAWRAYQASLNEKPPHRSQYLSSSLLNGVNADVGFLCILRT
jgi:hypothetical protein